MKLSTCTTIVIVLACVWHLTSGQISDWRNEEECGTRPLRIPKIINGSTAVHGHYPWMVSLQLNNRHHCGGSLIRPDWVLTAAHCVYRLKASRFRVKLGGNQRNATDEETSITLNVTKVFAHVGFNYATFADDVALVKLPVKVPYSNYIRPICMPTPTVLPTAKHDKATVAGWGKLRQGGVSADVLQEVELPLVENTKCQSWYRQQGKSIFIRPTQICAGHEVGGKDACQGDSGSPLMVSDSTTKRSSVIGIVSAGIGCALPKLPGLYTRVTSYIDWVSRTIQADELESAESSGPVASSPTTAAPQTTSPTQARPTLPPWPTNGWPVISIITSKPVVSGPILVPVITSSPASPPSTSTPLSQASN